MRTAVLPRVGRKDVRVVQENYKRRDKQAEGTVFTDLRLVHVDTPTTSRLLRVDRPPSL